MKIFHKKITSPANQPYGRFFTVDTENNIHTHDILKEVMESQEWSKTIEQAHQGLVKQIKSMRDVDKDFSLELEEVVVK